MKREPDKRAAAAAAEVRGAAFVRLSQQKPEPCGADLKNHSPKLNLAHHETQRSSKTADISGWKKTPDSRLFS